MPYTIPFAPAQNYPGASGSPNPWSGLPVQQTPVVAYNTPGTIQGCSAEELNFLFNRTTRMALQVASLTALASVPGPTDGDSAMCWVGPSFGTIQGVAVQGLYYWAPTSTLTNDGLFCVAVTGVSTGRWLRQRDYLTTVYENFFEATTGQSPTVLTPATPIVIPNTSYSYLGLPGFAATIAAGDYLDIDAVIQVTNVSGTVSVQTNENSAGVGFNIQVTSNAIVPIKHRHITTSTDGTAGYNVNIGASLGGSSASVNCLSCKLTLRRP